MYLCFECSLPVILLSEHHACFRGSEALYIDKYNYVHKTVGNDNVNVPVNIPKAQLPGKTLSDNQLDVVLEFVQRNKAIITNEVNGDIERERLIAVWDELTDSLNAVENNNSTFNGGFEPVNAEWSRQTIKKISIVEQAGAAKNQFMQHMELFFTGAETRLLHILGLIPEYILSVPDTF